MKQALVTGGIKGIGLAVTKMLLSEGYAVTATYAHDEEAAQKVKAELPIDVIRAAQDDKEQLHSLVEHLRTKGSLDCLVLNAGTTERSGLKGTTDEAWERVMQVMGVLSHSVSLVYGVSKAAEIALAKTLVKEFAGTGTTVNVIAPGFVDTDWQKTKPQEIRQSICNKTASGRFAEPEEIAEAVRFCVKNAFVNGSVIEIHGGYNYK